MQCINKVNKKHACINLHLKTVETIYTEEADTCKLSPAGFVKLNKKFINSDGLPIVKTLLQASVIPNFDANGLWPMSTRHACNHDTYSH